MFNKTAPEGHQPSNSDSTYMPQLDGLRAIAVCMVLAEHLWHGRVDSAYNIFPWGSVGVTLFFVLSGFLITKILLGYRERAAESVKMRWSLIGLFYKRRSLRIFPLYYLLASMLLIFPFYVVRDYWPYFTFCNNFYFYGLNNWSQPYGHTWTLAVEEQFYLLWPFLIMFIPRFALKKAVIIVIVSGLIFRLWAFGYIAPHHQLIGLLTPSSFDAFGLGALLAYIRFYENSKFDFSRWSLVWIILALAGAIGLNKWYEPFNFGVLFFFCLAVLSLFTVSKASLGNTGVFAPLLSSAPVRFIGKISYGLYIWHLPSGGFYDQMAIWATKEQVFIPNTQDLIFPTFDHYPLGYFYMNILLTFVLAVSSYFLVEQPILWVKDKYFK